MHRRKLHFLKTMKKKPIEKQQHGRPALTGKISLRIGQIAVAYKLNKHLKVIGAIISVNSWARCRWRNKLWSRANKIERKMWCWRVCACAILSSQHSSSEMEDKINLTATKMLFLKENPLNGMESSCRYRNFHTKTDSIFPFFRAVRSPLPCSIEFFAFFRSIEKRMV